jgi:hypothetical protein
MSILIFEIEASLSKAWLTSHFLVDASYMSGGNVMGLPSIKPRRISKRDDLPIANGDGGGAKKRFIST